MTIDTIQAQFISMLPALQKRIRKYAKRFAECEEAFTEMIASAWINYRQRALRGTMLPAHQLAFVSYIRLASGRTLSGHSVKDVCSPACYKLGRARRIFLSELECSKGNQLLPDSAIRHITHCLSTREHDTPLIRAAMRIDWTAFSKTLSKQFRRLLHCMVVGFSKGDAAKRLRVSPSRISQMLKVLGEHVREFFGEDIVPSAAA